MPTFSSIVLTFVLFLIISPTFRKDAGRILPGIIRGTDKFFTWCYDRYVAWRYGREEKKQKKAKAKAAAQPVNTKAIIELHVALVSDDPEKFQKARNKFKDDKAVQEVADRMLHAHKWVKPDDAVSKEQQVTSDGQQSDAGLDLENQNGQKAGAGTEETASSSL